MLIFVIANGYIITIGINVNIIRKKILY